MNVGEKQDVVSWALATISMGRSCLLRLSTVEIIGDMRVYRLLHDEEQDLHFWFGGYERTKEQQPGNGASTFCGSGRQWQDDFDARICKIPFKGRVMSIEDSVEIKQEDMLQLQLNRRLVDHENLIKLFSGIVLTLTQKFGIARRPVQCQE